MSASPFVENISHPTVGTPVDVDVTSYIWDWSDSNLVTIAWTLRNVIALTVFSRIPVTKTVSVIFFISMAVADLIKGIFVMPLSAYSVLQDKRGIQGLGVLAFMANREGLERFCTISGIIGRVSSNAGLFTLILISFDRFVNVYDSMTSGKIMTAQKGYILTALCWFFSILLALFPFFIPEPNADDGYQIQRYFYMEPSTQCVYKTEFLFGNISQYLAEEGKSFPVENTVANFFLEVVPIILPTYLIIVFCVMVINSLVKFEQNTKLLKRQIEPKEIRRAPSFKDTVMMRRTGSFKKKDRNNQVGGGVETALVGQGTAADHLEGQVVFRRQSRRFTQSGRSPQLAKDRWSQMSMKSLSKPTRVDNYKKAITTVIFMLLFFAYCYSLEWFCVLATFPCYLGMWGNFMAWMSKLSATYFWTVATVMQYINSAGNPFLYYFRFIV
eukprot:sb/3464742/